MEKKKLGNSGIAVTPLAFGGNVFGWTIDEPASFKLLDAFVDAGFNLIDTADTYSRWKPENVGGESETIIGNWMKQRGNRDKVIVATKFGSDMGNNKKGLSKKYMMEAVEASLKRLQTDYIDLYQSHFDDTATTVGETMEGYAALVKQGKVRAIGASNMSLERLKQSVEYSEANALPRYETLQPLYNLYDRQAFEKEFRPYCLEKNISVINYYSLASGFLTGKYRTENDLSKSARGDGNKKYMNERGFKILAALDIVAKRYNSNPATVSLAWLNAQPSIAAPIASATNIAQLNDLIASAKLRLDNEAMDVLNKASAY
jgi:aryl-alcohol dehydrogenase-like predicted oxidoreductase